MLNDFDAILKLYFETFGQYPVITGGSFWDKVSISEKLIDAIETRVAFVDEEVPNGALI